MKEEHPSAQTYLNGTLTYDILCLNLQNFSMHTYVHYP